MKSHHFYLFLFLAFSIPQLKGEGLSLYYWREPHWANFGDFLSLKLVERIVEQPVDVYNKKKHGADRKLLAIGSILYFAKQGDVVWGSGVNGKRPFREEYQFDDLDVRAVRGPLTENFLKENFGIEVPRVYGDPALLVPYFFPEFKKSENPQHDYIVIPHYSEKKFFPLQEDGSVVYPTDPWDEVIKKILDSKFVISSSLHGIILAEAYGIPARLLRITEKEPFLKYQDYYYGTSRPHFQFATSVEEALLMGGEKPFECDLEKLYQAFPFEFWPSSFPKTLKNEENK